MIQEDIYQVLSEDQDIAAIVGAKIYPGEIPQGAAIPAVVYSVEITPVKSLSGESGLDNGIAEITCWAKHYTDAYLLAQTVRAAFVASGIGFDTQSITETRDEETRAYGVVLTLSVWSVPNIGGSETLQECISFVISGGGGVIAAGASGHKVIPYACTITKWDITSSVSGSAVIDIQRASYANFPTFASIAASAKPTLSAAVKANDTELAGWTKTLAAGDRIRALVDSADVEGIIVITLYLTRTA